MKHVFPCEICTRCIHYTVICCWNLIGQIHTFSPLKPRAGSTKRAHRNRLSYDSTTVFFFAFLLNASIGDQYSMHHPLIHAQECVNVIPWLYEHVSTYRSSDEWHTNYWILCMFTPCRTLMIHRPLLQHAGTAASGTMYRWQAYRV